MIFDDIKAMQLFLRKAHDTDRALMLTTFIGEATAVGKKSNRDPSDAEVVSLLKKFVGNLHESLPYTFATDRKLLIHTELELLNSFMPKQLSQDDLLAEIKRIIVEVDAKESKDFGKVVSALREKHSSNFDAGLARGLFVENI